MSGSARIARQALSHAPHGTEIDLCQREHSASIKEAPKPYEQTEPPKAQKIIEFDCRGLEFVEFKPEVISILPEACKLTNSV